MIFHSFSNLSLSSHEAWSRREGRKSFIFYSAHKDSFAFACLLLCTNWRHFWHHVSWKGNMVKYDQVVDDGGEIGQRHILSVKISFSGVWKAHYDMVYCFWLNSNENYYQSRQSRRKTQNSKAWTRWWNMEQVADSIIPKWWKNCSPSHHLLWWNWLGATSV